MLPSRFGLAAKVADHPDRLSGGQQRVAVVRVIATRPRLLPLDEVASALDPELVGEVLELVEELKTEGMTMLLATHEVAFAREVAGEVCFLDQGWCSSAGRLRRCSRLRRRSGSSSSCGGCRSERSAAARGSREARMVRPPSWTARRRPAGRRR